MGFIKRLLFLIIIIVALAITFTGALAKDGDIPIDDKPDKDYKSFTVNHLFADVTFKKDFKSKEQDDTKLKSKFKIEKDRIELDKEEYPELNQPATIIFKNTYLKNPQVLHNGFLVHDLKPTFVALGEWKLDVPSWSSWELVETTWNGTFNGTTVSSVMGMSILSLDTDAEYMSYFEYKDSNVTDNTNNENHVKLTVPRRNITACTFAENECLFWGSAPYLLTLPNVTEFNQDVEFTVIASVHPNSVVGQDGYIGKASYNGGTASTGWAIGKDSNSGKFYTAMYDGSTSYKLLGNDSNNNEHMFAFTLNETNASFWTDGQKINESINIVLDSETPIQLGHFWYDFEAYNFDGQLECVTYYNISLDEKGMQYHHVKDTCAPDAVAYWSLEDLNGNDITRKGNDGSVTIAGINPQGILGLAHNFTITNRIVIPNTEEFENQEVTTVLMWINNSDVTTTQRLITKGDAGGTQFDFYIDNSKLYIYDGITQVQSASLLSTNQWHQVGFIYNGTNVTFVVDGAEATPSAGSIILTPNDANIIIGNNYLFNNGLINSAIDEVSIWDRTLTFNEVAVLYSMGMGYNPYDGLVSKWNLDDYNKTLKDSYSSNNIDMNAFHSHIVENPVTVITFDTDDGTTNQVPLDTANKPKVLTVTGNPTYTTGISGRAMTFNGVDQGINTDIALGQQDNEFAISLWVKPQALAASAQRGLFGQFYDVIGNRFLSYLTPTAFNVQIGSTLMSSTGVTFNDDTWYHLYAQRDGTDNVSLFVNGLLTKSQTVATQLDTQLLTIGYYDEGASKNYLNGTLDEVQAWSRALTNNEITALYRNPHLTNSFQFDGVDDLIDVTTGSTLDSTNGSISIWMYQNAYCSDVSICGIISQDDAGFNNDFRINTNPTNNRIVFNVEDGIQGYTISSNDAITNNKWTHIVATHGSLGMQMYIDGVLQTDTDTHTGGYNSAGANLLIGSHQEVSTRYFNGKLSQPKIFDRQITEQEVINLNNTNPWMKYVDYGTYSSILHNVTDYHSDAEVNIWHNLTLNFNEMENQVVLGRAGECATLTTQEWITGSPQDVDEDSILVTFGNGLQGDCFQYKIELTGDTMTSYSIQNYSINSTVYLIPYNFNISIAPAVVHSDGTIRGNTTFVINNTDIGNLTFDWYINGIFQSTEVISDLSSGDTAESTFNGFNSFDVVYYRVTPGSNYVTGTTNQSENITIDNYDFNYTLTPNSTTLELQKPASRKFTTTITDNIDNDVTISWYIDGTLQTTTNNNINLLSQKYEDFQEVNLTVVMTDTEFIKQDTWFVTIAPADVNLVGGLAIVIFILVVTGGLFALGFKNNLSSNKVLALILKRCAWVIAIYLMVLNSAIMMTIASSSGLDLTDEMFRYLWLFGTAGYVFLVFTVLKTLFDVIKLWKIEKQNKRMGENGE